MLGLAAQGRYRRRNVGVGMGRERFQCRPLERHQTIGVQHSNKAESGLRTNVDNSMVARRAETAIECK